MSLVASLKRRCRRDQQACKREISAIRAGLRTPPTESARTVAVMKTTRAPAGRRHLAGSPFNVPIVEEPVETYERHDLVTHDKYGLGSVIEIDGQASVLVDFGMQRVRVALPCGKLYKL
jgi:hypothetical protein